MNVTSDGAISSAASSGADVGIEDVALRLVAFDSGNVPRLVPAAA